MKPDQPLLILASASPRRHELVPLLGLTWRVHAADVDETSIDEPDPEVKVIRTAELKAAAVASETEGDRVILAADTFVVIDSQILNKPENQEDAFRMLDQLRGRVHQVYTGIVVHNTITKQIVRDVARIDVPMRRYSNWEIRKYIDTGDPLDKAGAYAIQHPEFRPAPELSGCFAAVIGLPLCHVSRALIKTGITIPLDVPAGCQLYNNYDCSVYRSILEQ